VATWKAKSKSRTVGRGSATVRKISMGILNETASEGWEFVFFGDSARLVDGPILIFKRKRLEPTQLNK